MFSKIAKFVRKLSQPTTDKQPDPFDEKPTDNQEHVLDNVNEPAPDKEPVEAKSLLEQCDNEDYDFHVPEPRPSSKPTSFKGLQRYLASLQEEDDIDVVGKFVEAAFYHVAIARGIPEDEYQKFKLAAIRKLSGVQRTTPIYILHPEQMVYPSLDGEYPEEYKLLASKNIVKQWLAARAEWLLDNRPNASSEAKERWQSLLDGDLSMFE